MNYGKLTAGTTKTAIDTAKPSEKGEIITYLSRMGDVLEQIAEWSKIVITLIAVHTVVDGDIPYIALGKETLGVVADFQIIPPHAGHILDDNGFDLSRFCKPYHLIPTGPIERYPRNAVINEKSWIWKTIVLCVLQKDFLLVCYAVALSVQSVLLGKPCIQSGNVVGIIFCCRHCSFLL